MSNPIEGGAYQRNAEHYIHLLAGANRDVELDDSSPTEDAGGPDALDETRDVASHVHHAADVLEFVAEAVFHAPVVATGAGLGGGTALGVGMGCELVDANRDGDVMAKQYQYDRMRGVLAALEGRAESPEVLAEARTNPEFAAGLRRVANGSAEMVERARERVERCRDDGYEAVVRGLDRGGAFLRRYHDDLAFHHAVDYARSQRAEGSDAWARIESRVAERATP